MKRDGLHQLEEGAEELYENAPCGYLSTLPDGRITRVNQTFLAMTGQARADVVDRKSIQELMTLPGRVFYDTHFGPLLRVQGFVREIACNLVRPGRDPLPVLLNAVQKVDEAGQPIELRFTIFDATERRRYEADLLLARQRAERYEAIVQASADAIVSTDAAGVVLTWNASAERLFGATASEAIGRPAWELIVPEDSELVDEVQEQIQAGGAVRREFVCAGPEGRRFEVEMTLTPHIEPPSDLTGISIILRDVSERAELERALEIHVRKLGEQSQRKDEFLAMLSHEMRNPLAPIRSALDLIHLQGAGRDDVRLQTSLDVIERQVGNLTKLVGDLMEVSRVVRGRISLDLQTVDVKEVVRHSLRSAESILREHRHSLVVNHGPDPCWVRADSIRLEEVLVNLLNNAAKYTPDGGRIEVTCLCEGSNVEIRIRDNGVGIDADFLPHVFDLFTQADASLDRASGGLGIGLSLVHRLVGLHGGSIEVQSPPSGQITGSEFTVRLPLEEGPAAEVRASVAVSSFDAGGLRVLIADDNRDLADVLALILEGRGYAVRKADSGPAAIRLVEEEAPEAMVVDIGLPGLNGYEVARKVRQEPWGQSVLMIAMTGYGSEDDIKLALEAGFDHHLTKPFDSRDLESLLRAGRQG